MNPLLKTFLQALLFALVLAAPLLLAQSGTGIKHLPANLQAPGSERISSDALAELKARHSGGFTQGKWATQAPAGKVKRYDIYHNSVILQHGDTHTVLPLHALVHLPETHKNKVVAQPSGTFVPWPQFYLDHRNWIFTHEINLKQAMGTAPIKKNVLEQFKKINRVVVALHQSNPISRLPTPAQ